MGVSLATPAIPLFVGAIALLLFAHVLRAIRIATLYPRQYAVRRFDLLLALAMSYAIGTIFPFRVGEIVRVLYVGKRCSIRYSYVAATIFAERVADAIFVGFLALGLIFAGIVPARELETAAAWMLGIGFTGVLLSFAIRSLPTVRHAIWHVASLFRTSICYGILDFAWSCSEIITGGVIGRTRFLLLSPLMWSFYIFSYYAFGRATGFRLSDVVYALLGTPLRPVAGHTAGAVPLASLYLLLFTLIPVLLILLYGFLSERTSIVRVLNSLAQGRYVGAVVHVAPVSDRFKQPAEYESFLVFRFINRSDILTDFGMSAIVDGTVQRLFPGGSDAITALVEVNDKLLIRKFALGDAGVKLKVQADWLRNHQLEMPLVEVVGEKSGAGFFCYDMPYFPSAVDFYDVIHTSPIEHSQQILGNVIDHIVRFHEHTSTGLAPQPVVDRYLAQKATRNAQQVLDHSKEWLADGSKEYQLNGDIYTLADWRYLLDPEWLRAQITDYRTAFIHGDLTIENIIVDTAQGRGMYIIDPNPDNIFDSPLIDWAKLMQSLHLGYEGLNKAPSCKWHNGSFSLVLTRSYAYNELFHYTRANLSDRFGAQLMREVAFHELINYLRLTPYKLRHAPQNGLTFFACTSILLREYLETYA